MLLIWASLKICCPVKGKLTIMGIRLGTKRRIMIEQHPSLWLLARTRSVSDCWQGLCHYLV